MEPDLELFARWLKTLRENSGLSQYALAQQSGLEHHKINRFEKQTIPHPAMDDLSVLARFFGLDLNQMGAMLGVWLVEEQEESRFTPRLAGTLRDLRDLGDKLDHDQQDELAEMLEAINILWERRIEPQKPETPRRDLPRWLQPRRGNTPGSERD